MQMEELFEAIKKRLTKMEHVDILKQLIEELESGNEKSLKKKIDSLMPRSVKEIASGT